MPLKAEIIGAILLAIAALFGVQEVRLRLALSGEASAKASLRTTGEALKASEQSRKTEHQDATTALSEAGNACAARVAMAVKSGSAIHKIAGAPVALDPTSHCPVRRLVPDGELHDAIGAAAG